MRRAVALALAVLFVASSVTIQAQTSAAQSAPARPAPGASHADSLCDSVVSKSAVDSVEAGLFLSVARSDGGDLSRERPISMMAIIGAAFTPPRPFRLTVFSGSPRFRFLRQPRDSIELHPPSVTGVYRVWAVRGGRIARISVLRASLMPGFDSAAAVAVRSASEVEGILSPPEDDDSMTVDVSFSTDSAPGSRRLFSAWFPRMPVVDAVPLKTNPAATLSEEAKADGVTSGDIVLRFVVDRRGDPAIETVELIRGTSLSLLRAAIRALPGHRFTPASIKGCSVAQVVEYAFNFLTPEKPSRH